MKNKNLFKILCSVLALVVISSCAKKLDVFPENELTQAQVYANAEGYKSVLAKVYGAMATSGNQGPAGNSDIQGLDEGSQSPFIRGWFNSQELPTDEAIVSWDDQTIKDFHNLRFTTSDPFLYGLYSRLIYNVALANEYLRESTDDKLSGRGISGADADAIRSTRAEVRFLRAFNYWCVVDLFGKSTFVLDTDPVGQTLPREIGRTELFNFVETELKAIETELAPAKTIEYGRVDRAAAWALLARMYLNAQVYTGTQRYTDAVTYSKKVIDAGYTLRPNYPSLFMADNDKQKDEFIYTINCDGLRTSNYGNTTFMVHAAASSDAVSDYGIATGSAWSGYRTTKQFVNLFADPTGNTDKRALFTNLGAADINNVSTFAEGVHVRKWRNVRTDGQPVSDAQGGQFSDIDFPVFRLAEMYLIYAEAVLRGGTGGDNATALQYVNKVRERAYGTTAQGQLASLNLQTVLDERGRELYWEGHRRTDLVRYNQLTTSTYLWQWKGGSQSGTSVDPKYNLMPIPQTVRTANPNLSQNVGY
ncbi:MAG: RagB/SusD family nutrient uptake outer membrane protein [Chitinophagaceae bacterium]|nr:MAG: RagB/SusD family nutrient uptake outer membrane protein [Chitinophagaceae bacterium]